MPPDTCPNCGADVPRNARACPECGSDEKTGWSDDAAVQGLDLPDDNFNYDEFARREFGVENKVKPPSMSWFWWVIAVLVLAAFAWVLLKG